MTDVMVGDEEALVSSFVGVLYEQKEPRKGFQ